MCRSISTGRLVDVIRVVVFGSVRVGTNQRRCYSVYLLYWYKSINTDAEDAVQPACAHVSRDGGQQL